MEIIALLISFCYVPLFKMKHLFYQEDTALVPHNVGGNITWITSSLASDLLLNRKGPEYP